jgi:uncharacterized protein (TIGR04255 family)
MIERPFGPPVPEVPLARSPLVFVVAQVRFERVASIGSEDFIAGFQEAIRGVYPIMRKEQHAGLLVGPDGQITSTEPGHLWRFDERPEGWQVTLAPDFVALSTSRYTRRHDFLERLAGLLAATQRELRVRYCERIGVRYVDRVCDAGLLDRLAELLRPEVLGTIVTATDGDAELLHAFSDTTYRLPDGLELHGRWGVLPEMATFDPAIAPVAARSWVLDLDAYTREPVAFEPVALTARAESACERIYRFFRWAVSDAFLVAHGGQP